MMIGVLHGLTAALLLAAQSNASPEAVTVWPAPPGEEISPDFVVSVNGRDAPVCTARVPPADNRARGTGEAYEKAAFTSFDMRGPVTVRVTYRRPITAAKVLPSSRRIVPELAERSLTFSLAEPQPLTVEVNGDWEHSLHIFANPPEANPPRRGDPNVVYFGPGIHEIGHLEVGSGKTVYIAGGAVVRGVIQAGEPFHQVKAAAWKGAKRMYQPSLHLHGEKITLRGRGILDGSRCPHPARNLLMVEGKDIHVEGVILRDTSNWSLAIRRSDRVSVENLKVLGYRANSDGIDVCNSRDVTVRHCFLRTWDDLVVVKTDAHQGPARHIVVSECVLWNEIAHALSIGAELRDDVDDVLFANCDVIHDKGREWTLRVYHCDSARVSNVRFSDLRIEESPRLISLWINKAQWTRDAERGHIDGVTFQNITAAADPLKIELTGFDAGHAVENVAFRGVVVNGRPLAAADMHANPFVRNVTIQP